MNDHLETDIAYIFVTQFWSLAIFYYVGWRLLRGEVREIENKERKHSGSKGTKGRERL